MTIRQRFYTFLLLLSCSLTMAGQQQKDVEPLLTTHWHQDSPYNDLCPIITDGNIKTVAGCVSTAASQIVYYWHRDNPEETSYDTPVYPYGLAPVTYSVPAGTPLKWSLMQDSYNGTESVEQREAVAVLVYVVGTSSWLNYGSSTGGNINDIISPFNRQFRLMATYASKSNFTQQDWEELLYNELTAGRPILYSGNAPNGGGHAVVIDGYDAARNLFHFNFGWGGKEDGYYTVDDSQGMNGYSEHQACIFNIKPQQRNISITVDDMSALTQGVETALSIRITNNSTLDIHGLRVYLGKGLLNQNEENLVFSSDTIIHNDGFCAIVPLRIKPSLSGSQCVFTITDSNNEVLYSERVSISDNTFVFTPNSASEELTVMTIPGGISITTTHTRQVTVYSAQGMRCYQALINGTKEILLAPGIYVVGSKKVIVK